MLPSELSKDIVYKFAGQLKWLVAMCCYTAASGQTFWYRLNNSYKNGLRNFMKLDILKFSGYSTQVLLKNIYDFDFASRWFIFNFLFLCQNLLQEIVSNLPSTFNKFIFSGTSWWYFSGDWISITAASVLIGLLSEGSDSMYWKATNKSDIFMEGSHFSRQSMHISPVWKSTKKYHVVTHCDFKIILQWQKIKRDMKPLELQ